MKFCPNCGNDLIKDAKFCSSCGTKISSSENKIDKSFEYLKSNAQTIKSEFDNSYVVNDIKSNAKKVVTEEIPFVFKKLLFRIIDILGILGFVIIVIQICAYFLTGKVSHFDEAYFNWNSFHSYDSFSFFSIFIAEIMPTTILPFFFMFLSGLRKKWLFKAAIFLIVIIFVIRSADSNRVMKYEESEINYRDSIQKARNNQY